MGERIIKISLIGDYNVGKSSLGYVYIHELFPGHLESTIGASYLTKKIKLGENDYNVQIWDTAGSEKFKSLIPLYIRTTNAVFLCFENYETESIKKNLDVIKGVNNNIPIYFVETKFDLRKYPNKPDEELLSIVKTHAVDQKIHKTSSITSHGIKTLFETAILSNYGIKIEEKVKDETIKQNCCIIF